MGLRQDKYMTKSCMGGEEATGRLPRGHEDTDSLQLLEESAVRWGLRCHRTWPVPLYASLLTGPPPHQERLLSAHLSVFSNPIVMNTRVIYLNFIYNPRTHAMQECTQKTEDKWTLGVGSLLPLGTEFRLPGLCGMACRKVCRAFS